MPNNILVQNLVQATNIDALNRSFVAPVALHNGDPIVSGVLSATAGEGEVFVCAKPSSKKLGVWIAAEPELVVTDGKYRGLDPDVRNFEIAARTVFTGIKPQVGDILTYTIIGSDTFSDGDTDAQIAANGAFVWNSSALTDSFNLHLLKTTYISVGSGALGATGRVVAYQFEVTAN